MWHSLRSADELCLLLQLLVACTAQADATTTAIVATDDNDSKSSVWSLDSPDASTEQASRSAIAPSDRDEELAEVLTELETQVNVTLSELGLNAAEIDIDGMTTTDIAGDGDSRDRERFEGDEWMIIVSGTTAVATMQPPVSSRRLDTDITELSAMQQEPVVAAAAAFGTRAESSEAPPKQHQETAPAVHLWPAWPMMPDPGRGDWAALFAPTWSTNYRQFGPRQLLGPPHFAVVTAATTVGMLFVLSVWALVRRTQRRRSIERQTQWAASVEILDAYPHYADSSV